MRLEVSRLGMSNDDFLTGSSRSHPANRAIAPKMEVDLSPGSIEEPEVEVQDTFDAIALVVRNPSAGSLGTGKVDLEVWIGVLDPVNQYERPTKAMEAKARKTIVKWNGKKILVLEARSDDSAGSDNAR